MRPDGKVVLVSNGGDASVSAMDVANGRSNSVSVIDAEAMTKIRDVAVGELPWGVVIR